MCVDFVKLNFSNEHVPFSLKLISGFYCLKIGKTDKT